MPGQRSPHRINENDFRPVLNSAHRGRAIRAALFGTALGLAAVAPLSQAAETASASQQYSIAAGNLDDVLNQFARQAGITLSSTPQLTAELQSPGLQGAYSTNQALRQLLNGTGLQADSSDGSRWEWRAVIKMQPGWDDVQEQRVP